MIAQTQPIVTGPAALQRLRQTRASLAGAPPMGRESRRPRLMRALLTGVGLLVLAGCTDGFDMDLRRYGNGLNTTEAARQAATAPRPQPDARGVISYPNYQVAVARSGDTVAVLAQRVGINAGEIARYNALQPDAPLNPGEILALPARVAEPMGGAMAGGAIAGGAMAGGAIGGGPVDITTLASGAIDRAAGTGAGTAASAGQPIPASAAATPATTARAEPVRHRVVRGESAYTIARAYNVSVRSLAEWNGLSGDMTVREGQYLLIPVAVAGAAAGAGLDTAPPGSGSATPVPPSASQPLPASSSASAPAPASTATASANMGAQQTRASAAAMAMPVSGKIIRPYSKGKNDGIDISAAAGTSVVAAEAGTVAAITRDTDQVPILVIKHPNNLLTVYANIDAIGVEKGASVARGQSIAKVRAGAAPFLHFEVRNGYDSVDPMRYLQ